MKCAHCNESVEDGTTTCPSCGHSPRRTLLKNGVLYALVGFGLLLCFGGVVVVDFTLLLRIPFGWLIVPLVIVFIYGYGLSLLVDALSATVDEDLDNRLGLFLRG